MRANIGPQERQKRFRFGGAALGVSVVFAALLVAAGIRPMWRLAVFLPLVVAALGFFQARDGT